jgi:hypothetical protein
MMYFWTTSWRWVALSAILLASASINAQLRQIDTAKLPQEQRVQKAYSNALSLEPMVRDWRAQWDFETPKKKVVGLLKSSLHDLQSAEAAAPENEELLLFTGLVGHFAYNVDVDNSYDTAVESFERAQKLAPADYRPGWFLGIHRCQTTQPQAGMERLLAIEEHSPWKDLPGDFWDDYIRCAVIVSMPAHALRALSHAERLGESPLEYSRSVEFAHHQFKLTDAQSNYAGHDAWRADAEKDSVRFTSEICSMQLSAQRDWRADPGDVAKGICTVRLETGPYPDKSGASSPTLLVFTRMAKPQETLDDFLRTMLNTRYPLARATAPAACPADRCLSFEIVDKSMYQSEGGGHFLALAFAEEAPDFPGLLFERPSEPPKGKAGEVTYNHPVERLHRLPGTLYSIVLLDSNASIFEKAAADFSALVRSLRLD